MKYLIFRAVGLCSILSVLVGCGSMGDHAELRAKLSDVKKNATGKIDPIPTYPPYDAFIYSATSIRSPFDRPVDIKKRVYAQSNQNIKPNVNRTREYLEGKDLSSLSMVGTLERNGTLWALIKDDDGRIHRVTNGNYVGKNHGKVILAEKFKIELIEIVSDGLSGWVERPNILALSEKE